MRQKSTVYYKFSSIEPVKSTLFVNTNPFLHKTSEAKRSVARICHGASHPNFNNRAFKSTLFANTNPFLHKTSEAKRSVARTCRGASHPIFNNRAFKSTLFANTNPFLHKTSEAKRSVARTCRGASPLYDSAVVKSPCDALRVKLSALFVAIADLLYTLGSFVRENKRRKIAVCLVQAV